MLTGQIGQHCPAEIVGGAVKAAHIVASEVKNIKIDKTRAHKALDWQLLPKVSARILNEAPNGRGT